MDKAALGEWLATATHTVDRVQVQPYYADDAELVSRYADRNVQPPDAGSVRAWHDYLSADRDRGVTWRQLLLVRVPLSLYWRAVMEWAFALHAGLEEIRVGRAPGGPGDFYILDGQAVATMLYDRAGVFLGAELLPQEHAAYYLSQWERQWDAAEDFQAWWDRHPQYRRGTQAA